MLEVTKVIMLVLLEVVKNFCSVMSGFESVVAPVTGGGFLAADAALLGLPAAVAGGVGG